MRPDGSFAVDVLAASLVIAAGMAMAFIPSLGSALSSAAPEEGGLASGIVNTSYQIGSALGLAAMTAVAAAYGGAELGNVTRLTDGVSAGLLGAAVIAAARALLAGMTLRSADAAADAASDDDSVAVSRRQVDRLRRLRWRRSMAACSRGSASGLRRAARCDDPGGREAADGVRDA